MNGSYTIGPGGSIRIDSGASLTTDGYYIAGGTITNNGTLELNGEELSAFNAAVAGTGEVHVINTGTVSPLNLRISGTMTSLSLLKIEVPSGRTVNLNGFIELSTGNFELKGGVLTGGCGREVYRGGNLPTGGEYHFCGKCYAERGGYAGLGRYNYHHGNNSRSKIQRNY